MATITADLAQLQSPAVRDKLPGFRALIAALYPATASASPHPTSAVVANTEALVAALLSESTGLVAARPLVSDLLAAVDAWPGVTGEPDDSTKGGVYAVIIQGLEPRLVSFEEPVAHAREKLAAVQESGEQWTAAARTLIGIKLDSGHRAVPDTEALRILIHIVRLFLEDEDPVSADIYLKRAGTLLMPHHDPVLQITYKLCGARILDAQRAFMPAAHKFLELSYSAVIDPEEKREYLIKSVTSAVLAGAGPNRSRLLASLAKDERIAELPRCYGSVLEKMHLGRILRKHEVEEFVATLEGHHLAKLADGTSVFDRAVIQHNLLAASLIYANISFAELGRLLGISGEDAEKLAASMIGEHRIKGRIDQLQGFVYFEPAEGHAAGGGGAAGILSSWDARVATLCARVDDLAGVITETAAASAAAAAGPDAMQVA
ncbi:hypothetical protein BC828DRAFT_405527 [Blastocladiella britannica]|nr:hypothetical protein BC828DRAFT_405527 [Blastocladiella britannica]